MVCLGGNGVHRLSNRNHGSREGGQWKRHSEFRSFPRVRKTERLFFESLRICRSRYKPFSHWRKSGASCPFTTSTSRFVKNNCPTVLTGRSFLRFELFGITFRRIPMATLSLSSSDHSQSVPSPFRRSCPYCRCLDIHRSHARGPPM